MKLSYLIVTLATLMASIQANADIATAQKMVR